MLGLAGPVVAAQLAQMSMGLTDTVMVGRLGKDALAGVALGNTVFSFFAVLWMGFVMAVGPMVSQAFGGGHKEPIERSVRQGFWLAAALTAPPFLILWNIGPFLLAIGQAEVAVDGATSYMRAISWGFLPFLWFVALRGFVEGISRPWPVTVIAFAGVAVNVSGNYVLMFGKLGFPALGLAGTGWASTIVYWFLTLVLGLFVVRGSSFKQYRIFSKIGRPDRHYFREILRIGWPVGVAFGIEVGLFMTTAVLLGTIGTTTLAAHQIAIQCAAFTFMVPLGIGMASAIRVGHAVGREDWPSVRLSGAVGMALSTAVMSVAALAFWILPREIIGIFLDLRIPDNRPVVELAITLLGIAAVFQVFDGIQVSAAGALRGLKDTRRPMLLGFISYWLIGLTIACTLGFAFHFGAPGMWWGLVLGLASAAVLLASRFHRLTRSKDGLVKVAPGV
ncbi:MAG: MATE family efflux transporter [Rhodothermales bacterium]